MARTIQADEAVDEAVELLDGGNLVAIPTETVYGLAADATNGEAVAKIFEAKDRPLFNPLIAHVADMTMAERIADFDDLAEKLAGRFWPGALTLVLPAVENSRISGLVTAGLETIAVRMPVGVARLIAAKLGRPLAAPSANPSGKLSATTAADVEAGLGDRIPLIVDGGRARIGVESTILKVDEGNLTLLRPGGISVEDIEVATGKPVERVSSGSTVEAPGMLASHYAPDAGLRLNAVEVLNGEALLAFGPKRAAGVDRAKAVMNLSPDGSLLEAAANLFSHLHSLDRLGARIIAVEPIPDQGLGAAINDRLSRAAAPRGGMKK